AAIGVKRGHRCAGARDGPDSDSAALRGAVRHDQDIDRGARRNEESPQADGVAVALDYEGLSLITIYLDEINRRIGCRNGDDNPAIGRRRSHAAVLEFVVIAI